MLVRTLRGVHWGWTVWAGADGQGRKARAATLVVERGPAGGAAASAHRATGQRPRVARHAEHVPRHAATVTPA